MDVIDSEMFHASFKPPHSFSVCGEENSISSTGVESRCFNASYLLVHHCISGNKWNTYLAYR